MKKLILTLLLAVFMGFQTYAQDSLNVLDLQQCIDIAIENNLSVRRSNLQKERARVTYNQSRAEMLPSLNVGGNYGYNWGRSIDPTSNDFITQQINFSGINGNANVTLFNWFRITNTVKQNRLGLESAEYDVDKAVNDISINIVTFYLNVILNRELVENARYQLESSQEQLSRTKKLVAGGALPRTNELELMSQVATNEVNLVNAENNLNLALLNLKQAMLLPVAEEIELVVPDLELTGGPDMLTTSEEVFQSALEAMPEIRSAELQVEQAAMGVKVAEAGYAPTLSLNGSFRTNYSDAFKTFNLNEENPYTINRDSNGDIITNPTLYVTSGGTAVEEISVTANGTRETVSFSDQLDQNLSRSLSLNLNIPIFNNLRANAGVQNAKINLQQAEIAVLEQKNTLRQIIEQAYNDAFAASKTYAASQRQVEALEETFRSIENQYNLGAANFTDYQVASNNLFRAKSDLVRAKYDFIFKTKVLDFYQGKNLTF
ncbi:TolC family protein [Marinoscillum sp.]|uniref:TolC family protein n=1 Tax=Marinoscillum sp. TaxID=2024838 RepID=UPI003BABE7AC